MEYNRRISDKVLDAFNMACDQGDREAAEGLYQTLELVLTRYGGREVVDNRKNVRFIVDAAARLGALRAKPV